MKNEKDYYYLENVSTGQKYKDFASYEDKLNLETGEVIHGYIDERYDKCEWLTLNEHLEAGNIKQVDELFIGEIRGAHTAAEAAKEAKERFGVDIPEEAFQHNIDAHKGDYKSGYVSGDYFIFTPCRCNRLRFDIQRYVGLNFQKTYIA